MLAKNDLPITKVNHKLFIKTNEINFWFTCTIKKYFM